MKPGCVGRCIYGPCSAVLVIAASGVRRSEGKAAPGDGDIYILYFQHHSRQQNDSLHEQAQTTWKNSYIVSRE